MKHYDNICPRSNRFFVASFLIPAVTGILFVDKRSYLKALCYFNGSVIRKTQHAPHDHFRVRFFVSFLFFLVSCFATSAMLCLRMGSLSMSAFFPKPNQVWTSGLTEGLMSYILFWTLLFDLVHIF